MQEKRPTRQSSAAIGPAARSILLLVLLAGPLLACANRTPTSPLAPTTLPTTGTPQARYWMALMGDLPRVYSLSASGNKPMSSVWQNSASVSGAKGVQENGTSRSGRSPL